MSLYIALLRPLLFRFNPETAHCFAVEACRVAGYIPLVPRISQACLAYTAPELEVEVAGLDRKSVV